MFRSAHQIVFVNYEDFTDAIKQVAQNHAESPVWFYSGYDCDSLANEPLTRFTEHFIPFFSEIDNAWLELRTKSTQVRTLLKLDPQPRVVTAFSFSDHVSHRKLEHGVPPIGKRIQAMRSLLDAGWPVGLRFDPVVYHEHYQDEFVRLLDEVFAQIDANQLHSVSLGSFRLTRDHYRRVSRLYPEEPLFAQDLQLNNGIISYAPEQERTMIDFCESQLMQRIPKQKYHPCDWHG